MHARGMRVIFDWTLNRASCDNALTALHPEWFARDASGQPIYLVPNRDYFCGFDFSQRGLRDWLLAAMQHWLREFGFDGMRFDDSDITPTDFLDEIRIALQAVRPDIGIISQSTDEFHHIAACDLTYDGSVRDFAFRIALGEATVDALRQEWEEATFSFPRGALRMRWLDEKEQDRAHRFLGPALHRAAATIQMTVDGVPHLLMGQEFNEPRWADWRWLFDDVRLDWDAFDQATFDHYQALIALRREHRTLREAGVDFIDCGAAQLLAYRRGHLLVLVNLGSEAIAFPAQAAGAVLLYADQASAGTLAPFGSAVLQLAR
jgi:glycosidase